MNKYFKVIILLFVVLLFTGCNSVNKSKYTIVATNFPCYDFVRAIIKDVDDIEVKMLIKPGSEIHSYEPTPQDIIDIENSNLFVLVGGESDSWIDDVLNNIDTSNTKIIKLMDLVKVVYEESVEGMEEDDEEELEYDEHVWTSPKNAITIVEKLKEEIINIDKDNKELYEENASKYILEIEEIDKEIREVVNNSLRKELIFGDRFPFRYFTDEYNLTYYAAFKGCSESSEASAKTISFLVDKIKKDKIPVVLHLELSTGKIAETLKEETGVKVLELNSSHNISEKDFESGITYVDIMKRNIEVLKEALN